MEMSDNPQSVQDQGKKYNQKNVADVYILWGFIRFDA